MKRFIIVTIAAVFVVGMPMAALAMSHGDHGNHGKTKSEEMKHHGDMDHAVKEKHKGHDMNMEHAKEMSHDMHKGHNMAGDDFVEIGKDTKLGVVATVKVKTYDDETLTAMSKMGMDATHHVMVFFANESDGAAVAGGKAALKVKDSSGSSSKALMMMQMGDGYGADVKLQGMMNTFEIGTKLDDGKKRQFSIMFHNM